MTPTSIRAGLAQALQDKIPNLVVSQYRTGNIIPPHALIGITTGEYDSTMGRGSDAVTVQVIVFASRADDPDGQYLLDQYVAGHGDFSVKSILEDTSATGLSAAMVRVRRYELGTASSSDGTELLAATFEVDLIVSGTT